MTAAGIVIDASTLINFLKIEGAGLLGTHPSTFLVTSQVDREVVWEAQRRHLSVALRKGHLVLHPTEDLRETSSIFSGLVQKGLLGEGESSAIAVAVEKKWSLATDDRGAIRVVKQRGLGLPIITTWGLFRELVTAGVLAEREARDLYAECGMR